jgi:Putative transposase, YhgA-like
VGKFELPQVGKFRLPLTLLMSALVDAKEMNDDSPLLPAITPIILYNGDAPWTAPTNVRDLFADASPTLVQWLPQMKCLLLDEGRLQEHPSLNIRNLAAAFFRTISPVSVDELLASVRELQELVCGNEELTRLLSHWSITLHPGEPRYTTQAEQIWQQGANNMGARQVIDQWVQEKIEIGIVQGRKEGLEQGREQGLEQGRAEGLVSGERELLLRLLGKRFGTHAITPDIKVRIARADRSELECWLENLLESPTIDGVFVA